MAEDFVDYTGIKALENIREAKNYNNLFEKLLLEFLGGEKKILDFGAGEGEFAKRLSAHGVKTVCIETDSQLYKAIKQGGLEVHSSLQNVQEKFPRIYTFHVIEHIENDIAALKDLKNTLAQGGKTGGKIFICVPAFMVLYSHFDKKIGHYRRYTKTELLGKLSQAGFTPYKWHYLDFIGFFAILFFKFTSKQNEEPNVKAIAFYDKYIFPVSRILDRFFGKFLGRHLLVYAKV